MPTAPITQTRRRILSEFGGVVQDLGVHSCRKKRKRDGTTFDGYSEHAWGNAWDGRVPSSLKDAVFQRFDQLKAQGVLAVVIDYGDGQFHVAGSPLMNPNEDRIPPCAGGSDPGGQPGTGTPDVLNPPTEGGTAKVPVGPTPPGMEDRPAGIREGSAADKARDTVSGLTELIPVVGRFVAKLSEGETWMRAGWAIGGLVLVVLGLILLSRDLIAGTITGAARSALSGG